MKEKLSETQKVFLDYLIEREVANPASAEIREKNTEEVPSYKHVYQTADKLRKDQK